MTLGRFIHMLLQHINTFPPEVEIYAIPLSIAIFTLMLPLLFSVVTRIDNKYSASEFSSLYLKSAPLISLGIFAVLDILMMGAYMLFRHTEAEFVLRISLCCIATGLLISSIFALSTALRFNNAQRLLQYIIKHYSSHASAKQYETFPIKEFEDNTTERIVSKEFHQFFLLIRHLICYAIEKNVAFMYDLREAFCSYIDTWKKYYIAHPQKPNDATDPEICYPKELYDTLIYVCTAYKKLNNDNELNSILASIMASLFVYNGKKLIAAEQATYDALYHSLTLCISNQHESLINDFQHALRSIYFVRKNEYAPGSNRMEEFAFILNATLYGRGMMSCVEDAIKNNFDAGIGEWHLIPHNAVECADMYLRITQHTSKEWHYYVHVASGFTSYLNMTFLHRYISHFLAYIAIRSYKFKSKPYMLEHGLFFSKNDILRTIKDFPKDITKVNDALPYSKRNYIPTTFWEQIYRCTYDYVRNAFIQEKMDLFNVQKNVRKDIKDVKILERFAQLVTNDIFYKPKNGEGNKYVVPVWKKSTIEKAAFIKTYHSSHPHYIGWHMVEHIMDSLAEIYHTFNTEIEYVKPKDLKRRIVHYICDYDYSFLTLGFLNIKDIVSYAQPLMGKFHEYFPEPCVVLIKKKDLPYIEWNEDSIDISMPVEIESSKEGDIEKWEIPQVKMTIDLKMRIFYKKDVTLRVLKIAA